MDQLTSTLGSHTDADGPAIARASFGRIVGMAARLLGVPAVLLTAGACGSQRVLASVGLEAPEAALPLCSLAAARAAPLTGAAAREALAERAPLPGGAPARFAAAWPLLGPGDRPLGALCLLDQRQRRLSPADQQTLDDLIALAESELGTLPIIEREQRYRSAVEQVGDIIFQTDMNGRWTFLNAVWATITGIPVERALGRLSLQFVHPDDRERCAELFRPLFEQREEQARHEVRCVDAGGQVCWMVVQARLVRDAQGGVAGVVGTMADITARKQTEDELHMLSLIASKTENIVIVTDREGQIEWVNESFTRISGYTPDEVRGQKPGPLLQGPRTDPETVRQVSAALRSGEPVAVEILNYRKDGTTRWISMQITPILDKRGAVERFVAIETDITERKRTEEALRESQHFVSRLADTIPHILYVFDLAEQRVVYVNQEIERLLGYSRAQILEDGDMLLPELLHPDDVSSWMAHLLRFVGGYDRDALDLEYRVRHADGSWRWMAFRETVFTADADGAPHQLLGSAQDITARKNAEEQLRSSEARHRALLNAVPDLMFRVDRDGMFLDYKGARDVELLVPPSQFLGQRLSDVLPPDLARRSMQVVAQAIQTGAVQLYEYQMPISGSLRDYEARVVGSGPREALVIVRDITDRKVVERMKNEFVATVSHELRTPLTSIRGALGLIAGGVAGELPAQARHMVEIAYKNSERLVRLINDILDIEKIESGKMSFAMRTQELLPLVEQAVESNRAYASQFSVTLKLQTGPGLDGALVHVDGDRLVQVLTNLLSNAAKFSPGGACVTVAVEQHGAMLRIAVIDRGPGIPAEFQSRMFQKFAQADSSSTRRQGGTGLGLSISRAIVERLGGQISFHTAPGQGSTFMVDLPEWHSAQAAVSVLVPHEQRVLVCEDQHEIAGLLQPMLEQAGFLVDVAYTASQARRLLHEQRYNAMTLDLLLPGTDGLQLIRDLRADPSTHDLPIVIVSARAGKGQHVLSGDAVAVVDWLTKPIDPERLAAAVRSACGGSQRPQVLYVEDDRDMAAVIRPVLGPLAEVTDADGLASARDLLARRHFDLVLLDLSQPNGSGLDVLPLLHGPDGLSTPVVVFSAYDTGAEVARKVDATLAKSRTTNRELQETITGLFSRAERRAG